MKRALVCVLLCLALVACDDGDTQPIPGAAFGPDLDAIKRFALGKLKLSRPVPPLAWKGIRGRATPAVMEVDVPSVLSDTDIALYRKIEDAQRRSDWKTADTEIKQLKNDLLVGQLLRERFLRTDYEPDYAALRDWMDKYGDQPGAADVYKLALKARPKNAPAPKAPRQTPIKPRPIYWGAADATVLPKPRLGRHDRRRARVLRRRMNRELRRDRLTAVIKRLEDADTEKLLGPARFDDYRMRIGRRWFQLGKHEKAFEMVKPAADRSGKYITNAYWVTGLAAWSLKKYKVAAAEFEKVANARNVNKWFLSAGAFWAARAYEALGDKKAAASWLHRAALHARTFYGMLARRKLGMKPDLDWRFPEADPNHLGIIKRSDAGKRGLALVQIGRYDLAAEELMRQYYKNGEAMAHTYLSLAMAGRLPAFAYSISSRLAARDGLRYDLALFPVPVWRPKNGYQIDRALIYAVMRQESAFVAHARSPAGARGLMQLMPATAAFIGDDRSLRREHVDKLYDPRLKFLLGRDGLKNNLFYVIAAYNAGEGNLQRWNVRDDPLLFIEAIHLKETRIYVERVMYNLWVYRLRLGQKTPSLDDLVAGRWPTYRALDGK
jgi:soluble lytic murein transglycosylase